MCPWASFTASVTITLMLAGGNWVEKLAEFEATLMQLLEEINCRCQEHSRKRDLLFKILILLTRECQTRQECC